MVGRPNISPIPKYIMMKIKIPNTMYFVLSSFLLSKSSTPLNSPKLWNPASLTNRSKSFLLKFSYSIVAKERTRLTLAKETPS